MDLNGKVALVFGGSSGIGLAAARMLHDDGARVVVISRSPDRARASLPEAVALETCDVRDEAALAALFDRYRGFAALVNAATGGERPSGPFLEMDLAAYRGAFDKLWGYTNTVRLGAPQMVDTGSIVLISGAPARRSRPGQIALASVGGAVEQFARTVAQELAPRRVNVVSPGIIDTPMFGPDADQRLKMLQGVTGRHAIPRPGTPEEVAAGIMFCLKNDFVTGTTVDVDGGWLIS